MSNKWKIVLGLVIMLSIGAFVMTKITKDDLEKIEKAVGSVHGTAAHIEIVHIEEMDHNRAIVFHEMYSRGRRLTVVELKKTFFGWTFESGFSGRSNKDRRSSVLSNYAIIVGRVPSNNYYEVKIEATNGNVYSAKFIEENGIKKYWYYITEEMSEFEEINDATVYAVTEDGEVIEEIEKPDNEPLY
ncbi:hypothetical protein P4637_08420 [Halalkalibacterium halodurans]|uniref:hypothetical protein n=1 Tax=Halalkalibacterium halodurans TaxID=86665 RepID=UPI002E1C0D2A|nr:hypothetical protein [Halalkalibacterium halodurans]MED4084862.1 hypothetical protein [Halalkalibacterium halodurans]MED4103454.1 hypothetical protein [Halalkalibacterium halodurans]MED4107770.1 hypothetical protein [Halalkalibacterium halodurans]MED4123810.1 hypothetical protein [Halalkalibacterium halodurans]